MFAFLVMIFLHMYHYTYIFGTYVYNFELFYRYVHSVSCQFPDIGSHSQLSNEQKRCISKQTHS